MDCEFVSLGSVDVKCVADPNAGPNNTGDDGTGSDGAGDETDSGDSGGDGGPDDSGDDGTGDDDAGPDDAGDDDGGGADDDGGGDDGADEEPPAPPVPDATALSGDYTIKLFGLPQSLFHGRKFDVRVCVCDKNQMPVTDIKVFLTLVKSLATAGDPDGDHKNALVGDDGCVTLSMEVKIEAGQPAVFLTDTEAANGNSSGIAEFLTGHYQVEPAAD